jgi:uncharacterized Zn finger protein (UPF0148 family)
MPPPSAALAETCPACGSANLFGGSFDADGYAVPLNIGDATPEGVRWTVFCSDCGEEVKSSRRRRLTTTTKEDTMTTTKPDPLDLVREAAAAVEAAQKALATAMKKARKSNSLRPIAQAAGLSVETVRKATQ